MSRDTIRLPHDAYRLLQTLRAAGHSAYVVGAVSYTHLTLPTTPYV